VSDHHNPYACALDGLVLDDPVAAFFGFCRERERIRILRESGAPAPWSDDPIFQRGRFLNVFREDDRVSKSIRRFAGSLADDLPALIQALFFARWCNKASTLDGISPDLLSEPGQLRSVLETLADQPWCNVTAYPVEAVVWEGKRYTRVDTAVMLFDQIKILLAETIEAAKGDVIRATRGVNERFGMNNDFPVFMAVMDLAWFRPDVIDPGSHVPTGIGAVAFLDRLQQYLGLDNHQQTCERMIALQAELWPQAKRAFQPIDIEYLSCECRKYYSYVHGTKQFEGKNIFEAGKSARLCFDIDAANVPAKEIQTQIHVLAGGPCSGKSSLLRALEQAGHHVLEETAESVLKAGIAAGRTAEELREDPVQWQQQILRQDYELFDALSADEPVFTDTSVLETLVFAARAGIATGPNMESWLRRKRYKRVFFLEPLEGYEQSEVRMESAQIANQISEEVRSVYQRYGYEIVDVPAIPVAGRVAFIQPFLTARL
jgi:predicted ATPase